MGTELLRSMVWERRCPEEFGIYRYRKYNVHRLIVRLYVFIGSFFSNFTKRSMLRLFFAGNLFQPAHGRHCQGIYYKTHIYKQKHSFVNFFLAIEENPNQSSQSVAHNKLPPIFVF